jgi:phage terminase large subunit
LSAVAVAPPEQPTWKFPDKLQFLFAPKRYMGARGGRGGAKSWGFARALLILGFQSGLLQSRLPM